MLVVLVAGLLCLDGCARPESVAIVSRAAIVWNIAVAFVGNSLLIGCERSNVSIASNDDELMWSVTVVEMVCVCCCSAVDSAGNISAQEHINSCNQHQNNRPVRVQLEGILFGYFECVLFYLN